jgi:hypothetical protein
MTVIDTDARTYDDAFAATTHCFNTAVFAALNAHRCDEVRHFMFSDGSVRMGLIAGRRGDEWFSPFSAPFGGFASKRHQPTIEYTEKAVTAWIDFLTEVGATSFRMTLPPSFYQPSFLTKVQHACLMNGFRVTDWDLNFYVETRYLGPTFPERFLTRSGRRNWHLSQREGLNFRSLSGASGLQEAYAVIRQNRHQKGYALSLTEEELLRTARLIPVDAFVVERGSEVVASAIVYHTTKEVVQVVYWGDRSEYQALRPMYFLAVSLFEHYAAKEIPIVDMGTAMIHEKPNYGLCEFKEAVGGSIQPKPTLLWKP